MNIVKLFICILGKTLHKSGEVTDSLRAETRRPNTISTEDLSAASLEKVAASFWF